MKCRSGNGFPRRKAARALRSFRAERRRKRPLHLQIPSELTRLPTTGLLNAAYGRFVSCMAFDADLESFLNTYLDAKRRKDPKTEEVDVRVFALFYRLVADAKVSPFQLSFSKGSNASSFGDLKLFTAKRLERLGALYHRPGARGDPFSEMVAGATAAQSGLSSELAKHVSRIVASSAGSGLGEEKAAGVRALVEATVPGAGGLGKLGLPSHGDAVASLARSYKSAGESERGHLCATAALVMADAVVASSSEADAFVGWIGTRTGEAERTLLGDARDGAQNLLREPAFTSKLAADAKLKAASEKLLSALASFPRSSSPPDVTDGVLPTPGSGKAASTSATTTVAPTTSSTDDDVTSLRELAPHLGRTFARRLLQAVDGNLERAITCVFEGQLPPQVASLPFDLDEEEETISAKKLPPRPVPVPQPSAAPSLAKPQPKPAVFVPDEDNDGEEAGEGRIDDELKARIKAIYADAYDDEYDDALDGSEGRIALEPLVPDVDGKFRDESGKLIPMDEVEARNAMAAPNLNRTRAAPVDTSRRPQGQPVLQQQQKQQQAVPLTPEQQAAMMKRQYQRKERRGSQVRARGADRKAGKMGP